MSNNPAKYEVLIKPQLRSILDINAAREPRRIVLVHRTLAEKVLQDILRSSTVRYRPKRPDLVVIAD